MRGVDPNGLDYRALQTARPDLYGKLEDVRQRIASLSEEGESVVGSLSGREIYLLREVDPAAAATLRSSLAHPAEAPRELETAVRTLRDALLEYLPEVDSFRWTSKTRFDQHRRAGATAAKAEELVHITPRAYEVAAACLRLRDEHLAGLAGETVLSIGEGASGFAKGLEERSGAIAVAVDWWYHLAASGQAARLAIGHRYVDKNLVKIVTPREAIAGLPRLKVAALAEQLPFAEGAFARVYLANVLQWYIESDLRTHIGVADLRRARTILDEALRVTRPGGEVRFNLGSPDAVDRHIEALRRAFSSTCDVDADGPAVTMHKRAEAR